MFAFGDPSRTPLFGRILVDQPAGTLVGNGIVYREATTFATTGFSVIDLFIIDDNKGQLLMQGNSIVQIYLVSFDFSLLTLSIIKTIPLLSINTRVLSRITSQNNYFIAHFGTTFIRGGSFPNYIFSSQHAFIYSSVSADTCYSINSVVVETSSGQIILEYTMTSQSSPFSIDSGSVLTLTELTGNPTVINQLNAAASPPLTLSDSWCAMIPLYTLAPSTPLATYTRLLKDLTPISLP